MSCHGHGLSAALLGCSKSIFCPSRRAHVWLPDNENFQWLLWHIIAMTAVQGSSLCVTGDGRYFGVSMVTSAL